jgi:hypothetical protein
VTRVHTSGHKRFNLSQRAVLILVLVEPGSECVHLDVGAVRLAAGPVLWSEVHTQRGAAVIAGFETKVSRSGPDPLKSPQESIA